MSGNKMITVVRLLGTCVLFCLLAETVLCQEQDYGKALALLVSSESENSELVNMIQNLDRFTEHRPGLNAKTPMLLIKLILRLLCSLCRFLEKILPGTTCGRYCYGFTDNPEFGSTILDQLLCKLLSDIRPGLVKIDICWPNLF